jgi:hypothetical protein
MGVAILTKGLITLVNPDQMSSRKSDGATPDRTAWERRDATGFTCRGSLIISPLHRKRSVNAALTQMGNKAAKTAFHGATLTVKPDRLRAD